MQPNPPPSHPGSVPPTVVQPAQGVPARVSSSDVVQRVPRVASTAPDRPPGPGQSVAEADSRRLPPKMAINAYSTTNGWETPRDHPLGKEIFTGAAGMAEALERRGYESVPFMEMKAGGGQDGRSGPTLTVQAFEHTGERNFLVCMYTDTRQMHSVMAADFAALLIVMGMITPLLDAMAAHPVEKIGPGGKAPEVPG
jgi:hypothetical protein